MRLKHPGFTYDLVKGLSSLRSCSTASPSNPEPPDDGILPLLGVSSSQPSEAALFFLYGERVACFSFAFVLRQRNVDFSGPGV